MYSTVKKWQFQLNNFDETIPNTLKAISLWILDIGPKTPVFGKSARECSKNMWILKDLKEKKIIPLIGKRIKLSPGTILKEWVNKREEDQKL